MKFTLRAPYAPAGDQPQAIESLTKALMNGVQHQTLLGVTGSGKTFTMANVIERIQKPTLILSHNKTLTAQLYAEFTEFFPHNAVEYFVSYYDYYQPEAYIPSKDLYIEKDSSINDEIDRLRLSATRSLLERRDVIIVASVSCIYGIGSPTDYKSLALFLECGMECHRKRLLRSLVEMQYTRSDFDFSRSTFRVQGDIIDVHPAYMHTHIRIELFDDEIASLKLLESISNRVIKDYPHITLYPAKHFVTSKDKRDHAIRSIKIELEERLTELRQANKMLEAHRLYTRTMYDLEMLKELGYCNGIENYSRHLSGRNKGEAPATLIDYFPQNDFLLFVDESHVTLHQLKGMYNGDHARKKTLIDFGFRLPSAYDNRPLKLEEFRARIPQSVYISATPGNEELKLSSHTTEQIIRPTGLVDPSIEVRPTSGQIEDIIAEIHTRTQRNERTLITTLTKRMSEDLTKYLNDHGLKAKYLHSEVETIERVAILTELRKGLFTCLVGVNLLREGLDLPEVSLVIILDANKVGFLRSAQALIQTIGRAARNIQGHAIMYANSISPAMQQAIDETHRRRHMQLHYNSLHNIQARSISKSIQEILKRSHPKPKEEAKSLHSISEKDFTKLPHKQQEATLKQLKDNMYRYAKALDFEKATLLRDKLQKFTSLSSLSN